MTAVLPPAACRAAWVVCWLGLATAAIPAAADPATDAGAARITAALEPYVGHVPGVVSVEAQGETYRLTLDAAPLTGRLVTALRDLAHPEAGDVAPRGLPVIALSPFVLTLTDRGDGTWGVQQSDTISLRADLPGLVRSERSSRIRLNGVFDPELFAFAQSEAAETVARGTETRFDGDGNVLIETETTTASTTTRMTAAANPVAGVDTTAETTGRTVLQRHLLHYGEGDGPRAQGRFSVEASVADHETRSTGRGLRLQELAALWRWLAALPSPEALPARQDELRGLVQAALPLFDDFRLSTRAREVRVNSAVFRGGFRQVDAALDATGLVRDGRLRLALGLEGPDLPVMILDPWMRPLVPRSAGIDATLSGFDLAAVAGLVLPAIDLTADDPTAGLDQDALGRAALPTGRLRIDLAPSLIEGARYSLAYSGWIETAPGGTPTGRLRLEATGLDAVEAQIEAGYGARAEAALETLRRWRARADRKDGREVWDLDLGELGGLVPPSAL